MLTKKDFQALAEILGQYRRKAPQCGALERTELESEVIAWLRGQNPRFDAARFKHAVDIAAQE